MTTKSLTPLICWLLNSATEISIVKVISRDILTIRICSDLALTEQLTVKIFLKKLAK